MRRPSSSCPTPHLDIRAAGTEIEVMTAPLCIDLFAGCFGWSLGWLELGGRVVGYDLEHEPHHGPVPRGADLVLQDVRSIDGARVKDASLILSSSPCQEFSYRAMPWKRAKALGPPLIGMELFAQAARIQREAIAAAGRFIPMIQENVRGAQPFVGRARWHYGSFYLWGDVPALMPITIGRSVMKEGVAHRSNGETNFHGSAARTEGVKVTTMGKGWYHPSDPRHVPGLGFNTHADRATKNSGGSWFNVARNTDSGTNNNPARGDGVDGLPSLCPKCCDGAIRRGLGVACEICEGCRFGNDDGVKGFTPDGQQLGKNVLARKHGSKSSARKAASARIAKIPEALARHIARVYFPR